MRRSLGQALGNAVVGVVAFQVAELLPGAVERRRLNRPGCGDDAAAVVEFMDCRWRTGRSQVAGAAL